MSNSDDCPVAVKPLEWVSDKHQPGAYIRKAATPVGTYEIGVIDLAQRTYYLNTPFKHHHSPLSFDAATTVAQADYEQRIRSALDPVAAPVAAGSDEVVETKPGLRDRLPLLAKWLTERSYFNEAKDIYGVLHFFKTAEATITADKAEIARLTAERDQFAAVLAQPWADKVEELATRAEASESRCAALMAYREAAEDHLKRDSQLSLNILNRARAALEAQEVPDKQA